MSARDSFGCWLQQRRQRMDLTQDALAVHSGGTVATFRQIKAERRCPSRRAAIAWSYEFLHLEAQALVRRLGAFVAGGILVAVAAVCQDEATRSGDGEMPRLARLATLTQGRRS